MIISLELLIIFALILLNGLLSMSEMAIISAKKTKLKKLVDAGDQGARAALKLAESGNDFLASIQIGITLIGVCAGAFSGATLSNKIAEAIAILSPQLAPYADALGLGVVVVVVTYFSLILGELVPKRLALNNPEAIAARLAKLIHSLGLLLHPAVYLLRVSTNVFLRLLGAQRSKSNVVTEEEVKILIEEGTSAGVFDKQEEIMMKRVLRLDDYSVADLMTPRTKVIALEVDEPLEDILAKIIKHNHSYFPVFAQTLDRPLGILSIKTILAKFIHHQEIDLRACISSPLFLPASFPAAEALEKFRASGKHIAFIVDEYGGFAGIITVYDITESIVGEMPDTSQEIDRKIVEREDGSLLVSGYTSLSDLRDYFNIELPEGEHFQTVAGFLMTKLGKIPSEGEAIQLGPYRFEVVDMDRHRVDKILIAQTCRMPCKKTQKFD